MALVIKQKKQRITFEITVEDTDLDLITAALHDWIKSNGITTQVGQKMKILADELDEAYN